MYGFWCSKYRGKKAVYYSLLAIWYFLYNPKKWDKIYNIKANDKNYSVSMLEDYIYAFNNANNLESCIKEALTEIITVMKE